MKKGDLTVASDFCVRAHELASKLDMNQEVARANRVFGGIYSKQQKWKESIANFQESIRIFEGIGMKKDLAESYYHFGLMWKAKGDVEEAKEHLEKAIQIFEKLKLDKRVDEVRAALKTLWT